MRIPSQEEFVAHLQAPHFRLLTDTIDALGLEGYIVGGYVRDYILKRPSKDVDVVVVARALKPHKPTPKHSVREHTAVCSAISARHR